MDYPIAMKMKSGILIALTGILFLAFSLRAEPPREEIVHAYRLLMVANADYDGHRVKAMEALRRAGRALDLDLKGDAPTGERQWKSDEQLREAGRLLHEARNQLEARDRERAAEHVDHAIQEIDLALKGRAPVPVPHAEGPREEIVHAYRLLMVANADYHGHRGKAMEALRRAGPALGLVLEGDAAPGERQWKSDEQLREARRLLHDARDKLESRDRERAAEHVDRAMEEIDKALNVR
jgi:hypothetical protein